MLPSCLQSGLARRLILSFLFGIGRPTAASRKIELLMFGCHVSVKLDRSVVETIDFSSQGYEATRLFWTELDMRSSNFK
jgi:hypothetical protein